jgi:hypothetical protein
VKVENAENFVTLPEEKSENGGRFAIKEATGEK